MRRVKTWRQYLGIVLFAELNKMMLGMVREILAIFSGLSSDLEKSLE
jgi:hypothetical protein